jgi:hypothetical protein
MKILTRNSDHAVIYAQSDLALSDTEASGHGWRDPNFNTANATMGEAELPPLWTGAVWAYAGGVWTVIDTDRHAQIVEDARKAAVPQVVIAIKAERDRRKLNGVKVGAQWIHSDTYSRTQWLGMVIMGASVPAIEWTTMDGSTVTTSQALAGQVFNGTAMLDSTLFSHASALIAQVEAAPDPATVDITAGWPATFEAV